MCNTDTFDLRCVSVSDTDTDDTTLTHVIAFKCHFLKKITGVNVSVCVSLLILNEASTVIFLIAACPNA